MRRRRIRYLFSGFLALLFTVGLLEIILRIIPGTQEFIYCRKDASFVHDGLTEDPDLFYRRMHFAESRLRGYHEAHHRKANPLVLCLGGSIVYNLMRDAFGDALPAESGYPRTIALSNTGRVRTEHSADRRTPAGPHT